MCHIFESIFLIMLNEAWNIVTSASSLIFFIRSSCFWISNFICFSFSSGGLWACSFSTSLILFCHQHRLSSSIPPAVSAFGLCPCKWGQKSKPLGCSAPSCLLAPPAPAPELPSQPALCFCCYWWHSGGLHTPGGGFLGLHLHPTKSCSGSGPPVHLCNFMANFPNRYLTNAMVFCSSSVWRPSLRTKTMVWGPGQEARTHRLISLQVVFGSAWCQRALGCQQWEALSPSDSGMLSDKFW